MKHVVKGAWVLCWLVGAIILVGGITWFDLGIRLAFIAIAGFLVYVEAIK